MTFPMSESAGSSVPGNGHGETHSTAGFWALTLGSIGVVFGELGWQFDIMSTSFFLSRRALKPATHSGMPRWQDRLFISLAQAANDATTFFQIPSERVVEIGTQVTV